MYLLSAPLPFDTGHSTPTLTVYFSTKVHGNQCGHRRSNSIQLKHQMMTTGRHFYFRVAGVWA
jgi:hypothetical protein